MKNSEKCNKSLRDSPIFEDEMNWKGIGFFKENIKMVLLFNNLFNNALLGCYNKLFLEWLCYERGLCCQHLHVHLNDPLVILCDPLLSICRHSMIVWSGFHSKNSQHWNRKKQRSPIIITNCVLTPNGDGVEIIIKKNSNINI